ncbi:MAG: hypothetical protein QOD07_600 [Frankiaceae bacterium]|nr:hypothetical protein [Frankiaceae bacterium]
MTALIAVHAAAATFALMLGAVVITHRPRGDRTHRRLGRVWFAAMYFVVLSSFGIKRLTPGHFSWIHGLSLFTFVTLTLALYGARTHNVALHRGNVVGSYFGLVGAGIAASAFPVRAVPQLAVHHPLVLVAAVALIAALVAIVVRAVTSRQLARYVRWGLTKGALSGAYDDSAAHDGADDGTPIRGRVGRNPDPLPDRRWRRDRGDGAEPGGSGNVDVRAGAAAR